MNFPSFLINLTFFLGDPQKSEFGPRKRNDFIALKTGIASPKPRKIFYLLTVKERRFAEFPDLKKRNRK